MSSRHSHHPPHHDWHDWEEAPEEVEEKRKEVEKLLAVLLGNDSRGRAMCRLGLEDGPWHRYEATTAIVGTAVETLKRMEAFTGRKIRPYQGPVEDLQLHLPPHLAGRRGRSFTDLKLPSCLLHSAFKSREAYEYVIEALAEGPNHDVVSNVILIMLVEALYDMVTDAQIKEGADDVDE